MRRAERTKQDTLKGIFILTSIAHQSYGLQDVWKRAQVVVDNLQQLNVQLSDSRPPCELVLTTPHPLSHLRNPLTLSIHVNSLPYVRWYFHQYDCLLLTMYLWKQRHFQPLPLGWPSSDHKMSCLNSESQTLIKSFKYFLWANKERTDQPTNEQKH